MSAQRIEPYLREKRKDHEILLMTHIVLGYPSFDDSLRTIEAMVEAGVDLMELQIPFSEPIADGPVILRANQEALEAGSRVERCIEMGEAVAKRFDIPFLFMTYCNPMFRRGVGPFVATMKAAGLRGAIVPDLPPEEGSEYIEAMRAAELDPIFIFSPNTDDARMKMLAEAGSGFVYCVARKGVTGAKTEFSESFDGYLARCRAATSLPLAVGFGVAGREDVDALRGKADIAVVGTQSIRVFEQGGAAAVGEFLRGLR